VADPDDPCKPRKAKDGRVLTQPRPEGESGRDEVEDVPAVEEEPPEPPPVGRDPMPISTTKNARKRLLSRLRASPYSRLMLG
jgi:hypothetical protein